MSITRSDAASIRAARARAEAEQAFWEQHYRELLDQYPEQFVAVSDGEVVAADADLLALHRMVTARGLDRRRVWVRFITAEPRRLLH